MNKRIVYGIIIVVLILLGLLECRSCNKDEGGISGDENIEEETTEEYEDGTYCAEVDYFNPNTGTRGDYTLEVEVENNEVVRISFGNGGWLDSDHMTPQELDENGECNITSDRNYEYGIRITGQDCGYTDIIEEEQDPEIRYTVSECAAMYNMTQHELKACLKGLNIEPDELLSEETCKNIGDYLKEFRALEALENEINNGYVQRIEKRTMYGVSMQTVIISKHGINYMFEVRGGTEVTMGTAKFDENISGWQLVYIKQYPDVEKYSGYYMRIIDSGF